MSDDSTEITEGDVEETPVVESKHARAVMVDSQTNKVINSIVVVVDDEGNTTFAVENTDIVVIPDDSEVGLNWTYSNGQFSPPVSTPPED